MEIRPSDLLKVFYGKKRNERFLGKQKCIEVPYGKRAFCGKETLQRSSLIETIFQNFLKMKIIMKMYLVKDFSENTFFKFTLWKGLLWKRTFRFFMEIRRIINLLGKRAILQLFYGKKPFCR